MQKNPTTSNLEVSKREVMLLHEVIQDDNREISLSFRLNLRTGKMGLIYRKLRILSTVS